MHSLSLTPHDFNIEATQDLVVATAPEPKNEISKFAQKQFEKIAMKTSSVPCLSPSEAAHRFEDIECPRATAIRMGDTNKMFLHANYVKTADGSQFIAAQSPFSVTSQKLFWYIALRYVKVIISLTNENDDLNSIADGRKGPSDAYPSKVGETRSWKTSATTCSVDVTCLEQFEALGMQFSWLGVSTFSELHDNNQPKEQGCFSAGRKILHIKCTSWADASVPTVDDLFKLTFLIDQHLPTSTEEYGNIMVQCLAGNGRTGTLIVASTLKKLIQAGKVTLENLPKTIRKLVLDGRKQRGNMFVETPEQLQLIFEFGYMLIKKYGSKEKVESAAS